MGLSFCNEALNNFLKKLFRRIQKIKKAIKKYFMLISFLCHYGTNETRLSKNVIYI